jgi:LysR family transcriptional regulator, nitrogen assimilation regulatory protein
MEQRITLRQVRAVIAVAEEGSFTRAAAREHATQSGVSQHVAAVERSLGVKLFERSASGVMPTPAGLRYYQRCVEAVGKLEHAGEDLRALEGAVSGALRIGLMPTFTRAALAPALEQFVPRYPDVRLNIVEGYSGALTDMVMADELDLAIVPTFEGRMGLKSRLLVRDREMLISGKRRGLVPLAPARLRDLAPLKIVVPGQQNVRRRNIDVYLQTHGIDVAEMIEMDAMIGTLEFVARTDWVAVPPLYAEFVTITPARRALSTPARLFLEQFEAEIARIQETWSQALARGNGSSGKLSRSSSRRHPTRRT